MSVSTSSSYATGSEDCVTCFHNKCKLLRCCQIANSYWILLNQDTSNNKLNLYSVFSSYARLEKCPSSHIRLHILQEIKYRTQVTWSGFIVVCKHKRSITGIQLMNNWLFWILFLRKVFFSGFQVWEKFTKLQ